MLQWGLFEVDELSIVMRRHQQQLSLRVKRREKSMKINKTNSWKFYESQNLTVTQHSSLSLHEQRQIFFFAHFYVFIH